jgi:hypothetical protein
MLVAGLIALLFILGLFFSMLGSTPKQDNWSGESSRGK